jgi:hypothetical protein
MMLAHCLMVRQSAAKWCTVHDVAGSTIAQENAKLLHGQGIKNIVAASVLLSLVDKKLQTIPFHIRHNGSMNCLALCAVNERFMERKEVYELDYIYR